MLVVLMQMYAYEKIQQTKKIKKNNKFSKTSAVEKERNLNMN